MKVPLIVSTFALMLLASCGNSRTQDEHTPPPPPPALADKSSSDILLKRGGGDLVESLYSELLDNTPELKEFENRLENLGKSQADSTAEFDKYDEKVQSYYNATDRHLAGVKDSVLREKIKTLIAASLTKYNASVSKHKDLLKAIDKNTVALSDLHTILKITRTLPIIEKYETGNLPAPGSIDAFLKQLDGTLKYADTLIKK